MAGISTAAGHVNANTRGQKSFLTLKAIKLIFNQVFKILPGTTAVLGFI
jgi:hypothetical protein